MYEALIAAKKLEKEIDCQVLNCCTVKPLDEKNLLKAARKTGCVVTAEEHQWSGGLAGAVAEFLAENFPVPVRRVGVKDKFGESGETDELFKTFELTSDDIVKAVRAAVRMKKKMSKDRKKKAPPKLKKDLPASNAAMKRTSWLPYRTALSA